MVKPVRIVLSIRVNTIVDDKKMQYFHVPIAYQI